MLTDATLDAPGGAVAPFRDAVTVFRGAQWAEEADPDGLVSTVLERASDAGVGVVVTDAVFPYRPAYASGRAAILLQRCPDALLRSDMASVMSREVLASIRGLPLEGAAVKRLDETLVRADGRELALEVHVIDATPGEPPRLVWFVADRTDCGRSEEQLRQVVESLPEAVYMTDGTTLIYANRACAALFGFESAARVEGHDATELVDPEDVGGFVEHLLAAKRGAAAPGEYRMRSLTGRRFVLEARSIAIDYLGRPVVLSFGQEVTRRKQLETEAMQADRLAALGTLAGSMAHAINNPLSYVMLNLEHLGRRLPGLVEHPEAASELGVRLAEAHDGATRVATVVRQMRLLSKMRDEEPRAVDLVQVIEAVLALVANEIRHRGQLSTRYGPTPPVYVSEGRLEHALLNLLLFAARSLPEEGERPGRIEVETGTDAIGRAFVRISDNGPGLGPGARGRLFEPFGARDDGGLGLTVCHDLIRSMSGEIEIESESGLGTQFLVSLPPTSQGAVAGRPSQRSEPPQSYNEPVSARVLVIDDDVGVANSLRVMLQEQHDVLSEQSGQAGLRRLLKEEPFDVVFCDLVMPDLGGIDIYYALQLNRPGAEQKLVFMTGGVFTPDAETFLTHVPNPRVEKPFSLRQVEHLVRSAVGKGRSSER